MTPDENQRHNLFLRTYTAHEPAIRAFVRRLVPEQGRWVHLATVYDSAAKTVRFHLNGQFDKEMHQAIAHPAQIGNWDRQDRKRSGRVDDLIILGRAMTEAEIRDRFEAGNPYRQPPVSLR